MSHPVWHVGPYSPCELTGVCLLHQETTLLLFHVLTLASTAESASASAQIFASPLWLQHSALESSPLLFTSAYSQWGCKGVWYYIKGMFQLFFNILKSYVSPPSVKCLILRNICSVWREVGQPLSRLKIWKTIGWTAIKWLSHNLKLDIWADTI